MSGCGSQNFSCIYLHYFGGNKQPQIYNLTGALTSGQNQVQIVHWLECHLLQTNDRKVGSVEMKEE